MTSCGLVGSMHELLLRQYIPSSPGIVKPGITWQLSETAKVAVPAG